MEIKDIRVGEIKGFLDAREGRCLYELAADVCSLGPCLEIGSYCGKSSVYIGAGCKRNKGVLFSIDHHKGSEEQQPGEEYFDPNLYDVNTGQVDTLGKFKETIRIAGLEDTIIPIVAMSEVVARAWATPLGLVFIDGGHSFEDVFVDYNSWAGHVVRGGYLIFHDIFKNPKEGGQGPYTVYQYALASGLFLEHPMVGTLGILQRRLCLQVPEKHHDRS